MKQDKLQRLEKGCVCTCYPRCYPTSHRGNSVCVCVFPWLHVFYLRVLQAEGRHQCVLWQNNKQWWCHFLRFFSSMPNSHGEKKGKLNLQYTFHINDLPYLVNKTFSFSFISLIKLCLVNLNKLTTTLV